MAQRTIWLMKVIICSCYIGYRCTEEYYAGQKQKAPVRMLQQLGEIKMQSTQRENKSLSSS